MRSANLDGARAVLITGAGRAFCSGADVGGGALTAAAQGLDPGAATYDALTNGYNPTLVALADLSVPVVTAVRGPAAGIGCSLALAADFCVASDTAYFLQAFVNIGLVPDGGASWMLTRLIGRAARDRDDDAGRARARRQGARLGDDPPRGRRRHARPEAFALAERLAAGPTVALGLMRRQLHAALADDYEGAMLREAENQRAARGTADSMEGGMAFLQKRKAAFKGA